MLVNDKAVALLLCDYKARIAANMRYLRKSKRLSASKVALASGISLPTLFDLERAKKGFYIESLVRLSLFYGVSMADLLTVDLELNSQPPAPLLNSNIKPVSW